MEVKIEKGMRDGEKVVFKEKSDEKPGHFTLETSGEDVKLHSKGVEKM